MPDDTDNNGNDKAATKDDSTQESNVNQRMAELERDWLKKQIESDKDERR